jgi:LAS superfamily LD-carboxypeptidase LdcB
MFDTQQITTLIIAALGSGGLSSIVTGLLSHRKNVVEIEQLKQQISDNEADTQIKLNDHIQKQMMELSETYKHEFENRTEEIKELRKQNELLKTRVSDLSNQINQLMTWVAYDSMRYQEWLEAELLKRDPNIQFPKFRKPPKFVQKFMDENNDAPDAPPQGFTEDTQQTTS